MQKIVGSAALLALGLVLALSWNAIRVGSDAQLRDRATARDAWVEQQLARGSAAPARGWLDHPRHGTYGADPERMRTLIRDFHAAGAPRVFVIGIQTLGKRQLADTVGVRLPPAGLVREQLFDIAGRMRGRKAHDRGQRYLTVSVD